MPREVAHGFIALEALKKTKSIGLKIESNPILKSAFLLGSISPDSGYYYKLPFSRGDVVSDLLHAVNEDNSFHLGYKLISNSKPHPR